MRTRALIQAEEELFKKILSLQDLIASVKPMPEACTLLCKQLQKIEVYADDLTQTVNMLLETIRRREANK